MGVPILDLGASASQDAARVTLGRDGVFYHRGRGARPEQGSSAAEVLEHLNRAYARPPRMTRMLAAVLALAVLAGLSFGAGVTAAVAFAMVGLAVLWLAFSTETAEYSARLEYRLEGAPEVRYRHLLDAFRNLERSGPIWHLEVRADGRRRRLVRRRARPGRTVPPRVQCNLRVPCLRAGRQRLYFFPDRLLVYEMRVVWAVYYPDLRLDVGVLHRSGAGRPLAVLTLRGGVGLQAVFQCSSRAAAAEFAEAVAALTGRPARPRAGGPPPLA
jgi:hypothetical protein